MAKVVELITRSKNGAVARHAIIVDSAMPTQPVVIKASKGDATFELKDVASKVAPNQVLIKRVGKNLNIHLAADGDASDPDGIPHVVLEDYVSAGAAEIVGLAEDGLYHPYVPQEGAIAMQAANLTDGAFSYQSLGSPESLVPFHWPTAFSLPPFVGVGAVALFGALAPSESVAAAAGGSYVVRVAVYFDLVTEGASVKFYDENGKLLGETDQIGADGFAKITVSNGYKGKILAVVTDANLSLIHI